MLGVYIITGLCALVFIWSCIVVYRFIKVDLDFSDLVKEETMVNRRQRLAVRQRQQNARRVQFNNTYNADELFEEIPGDNDNIMLNLPTEALDAAGLKIGDSVDVEQQGDSIVIKKSNL